MKNIVFLDAETIPAAIPLPPFAFAATWKAYPHTRPEEIVERAEEAEIIITNKVPLVAATLERLPKLELIAIAATGYDIVDLTACRNRNITVCNVRDYARTSVPEHVLAMIFALRRNLAARHREVMSGAWERSRHFCLLAEPIADIAGTTLGIIGSGSLGRATGRLAEAVGIRVLFSERREVAVPRSGRTAFFELLATADIVSLHCPLNAETAGMIGAAELARMKPGALLINTARGGLVDEAALADALRSGEIGGAGFDVLTTEPPRKGNPLLDPELPNFILTPHIAWGSTDAVTALAAQVVENINSFVAGTPLRVVT